MAIPRMLRSTVPTILIMLAACTVPPAKVPQPIPPAATPRPSPTPVATVAAIPLNWTDAAVTPGTWLWQSIGGQSVARFGQGLLDLRCDRAAGQIVLLRSGAAQGEMPVTVLTSSRTQTLTGSGDGTNVTLRLSARDPLLDAMAFSRGRFAVEVAGLPTLYLPSWPEISRVIEDCR